MCGGSGRVWTKRSGAYRSEAASGRRGTAEAARLLLSVFGSDRLM